MKKALLSIVTIGFVIVVLSGFSNGLTTSGMNRTGAGGSQANCDDAGCHGPNNSLLDLNINLRELGGGYVGGKYNKSTVYWVVLKGHTSSSLYPEFGFQFASASSTNQQGHALQASGLQIGFAGGYEIVEQLAPKPKSGFNDYVDSFLWQSPPTGDVVLYATMLASNDDNFHTGDIANNNTRSYIINSIEDISEKTKISVYPNPVKDKLHVSLKDAEKGEYKIAAYNLNGQAISEEQINISGTEGSLVLNTSAWAPGNYILKIKKDGAMRTVPVVKL